MANNLKKIQFKHFCGVKNTWEARINSNVWNNDVVFGKVWNGENRTWEYKIYAGKVVNDSSTINYIYEIPTKEYLQNIENQIININSSINIINNDINDIINTLNYIDISINSIENHINIIDSSVLSLDASVREHEFCLNWKYIEG